MFAVVTANPGCGKSTLIRMFNGRLGLEPHFFSGDSKRLLQKGIEAVCTEQKKKVVCVLDRAETGKYMSGQYICIPDIDVGCPLSRMSDTFWNKERLCAHMREADAVTVTYALKALSEYLGTDWV